MVLYRLWSVWRRIFEPEITHHLSVVPEGVCYAAYQRKGSRAGTSLPLGDDLLDKSLVLGGFSVVKGWRLDNLTTRQPNERLRTQETSRQVEIDFIWQSVGKDVVQVQGYVRCGRMVGMVVRGTVGRRRDDERKRHDSPFRREYQRVLDHGSRPSILICVLRRFNTVVLRKRGHGGMPRLVVLDHVNRRFECLVVHIGGKGWRVFEPDQNSNVEKLVLVHTEVIQDGALRGKSERRRAGSEIKRGNQFVHPRIQQSIAWTINRMDI